jgi:hypothetical protein
VTFPFLRVFHGATFLLALVSAHSCFAQATVASTLLPDAPSWSSSQQTAQAQAPAPAAKSPADAVQCINTPAPPNETEAQRKLREQRDEAACEVKREEKQRAGGVIPQFNVVENGQGVPLSPSQKLNISLHTVIDPYTIGLAFIVGGGFGELSDSHTGYGHGPAGFFKRVGASYADNVNGNIIGNALLPIVLHQDPRYFRKGTGSIKSRIVYSALSTFICRGDNGKRQFNTSNVLGNFIAGAISNAYYPQDERGVGLTLENGLTVTLEGMVGAQLLEFSPDVTEKIKRHHQRKLAEKAAAAAAASGQKTPATTPQP